MTSEIEQQFFSVFGIEPLRHVCYRGFDNCIDNDYNCHCHNKKPCKDSHVIYPDITAEKLLVLLCIVIDEYNRNGRTFYLDSTNVKELKEEILDALMGCIDATCDLFEPEVTQIQQLFKEDE